MSVSIAIWNRPLAVVTDTPLLNSDGNAVASRGIWVGSGGDLDLVLESGESLTLVGVPDGTFVNFVWVKQINTANTTASDLACGY